jgi:hypothetical protein
MNDSFENLLSSIYRDWDLVSEEEKDVINKIDDKYGTKGEVGPKDIKYIKKLLRDIKSRK